jgi:hypothetical protein
MRYGHSVNTDIPEDPNEAEFPPTPWPDEVTMRIKAQAAPQVPAAQLLVGGALALPAPGSPPGWTGPALGQALPISAAASGLVDYSSPYSARTVEGQQDDPPDEELQRFRRLSNKAEAVHAMVSWTTLESFPLKIGISLPIQNPDGGESHEGQLWEETEEQWIIEENHADFVYSWLSNRFVARSWRECFQSECQTQ